MTEKRQAPHLLNENPILVYPTLAVALGINKAVVFQQLHFLLNGQKTSNNTYNYVDDRWWVYNSYPEWKRDYFPWLSISSLKGIFNQLEDQKLVIARQSVKNKSDRRKWYTIDYGVWDKFCLTIGQILSNQPLDKKYPMDGQEVSNGYSETSSKTSSEKKEKSKRAASKKKDLTELEVWQGRLKTVAPIVSVLLAKFERAYDPAFNTPETYMTLSLLKKYIPYAEELTFLKMTPELLLSLCGEIEPEYKRQNWTFALKTIGEKAPSFMVRHNKKPVTLPPLSIVPPPVQPVENITPEERQRMADESRAAFLAPRQAVVNE